MVGWLEKIFGETKQDNQISDRGSEKNTDNEYTNSGALTEPANPVKALDRKENRKRNKTFNMRFSENEMFEMNQKIEKSGLSRTDFLLSCIRRQTVIVVPDLSSAMTEIRRQGANINQIAQALNEYAVGLTRYGIRINNENAVWRGLTYEISDLREDNYRLQKLLEKLFDKLNQISNTGAGEDDQAVNQGISSVKRELLHRKSDEDADG